MEKLGITIRDADGSLVASMESEDATGFLVRGVVLVRGTPTVLLGVNRVDGPSNRLYAFRLDGAKLLKWSEWGGSAFDYGNTADGDLKVVITKAYPSKSVGPYPWDSGLPKIVVWNGIEEREDTRSEKPLIDQIAQEASADIESSDVRPGLTLAQRLAVMNRLRDSCRSLLDAEIVLGDAERATRLCALARKKIEQCDIKEITGAVHSELSLLDTAVENAKQTDVFRRALAPRH